MFRHSNLRRGEFHAILSSAPVLAFSPIPPTQTTLDCTSHETEGGGPPPKHSSTCRESRHSRRVHQDLPERSLPSQFSGWQSSLTGISPAVPPTSPRPPLSPWPLHTRKHPRSTSTYSPAAILPPPFHLPIVNNRAPLRTSLSPLPPHPTTKTSQSRLLQLPVTLAISDSSLLLHHEHVSFPFDHVVYYLLPHWFHPPPRTLMVTVHPSPAPHPPYFPPLQARSLPTALSNCPKL